MIWQNIEAKWNLRYDKKLSPLSNRKGGGNWNTYWLLLSIVASNDKWLYP